MAFWSDASSFATGAGTLVLAVATFASVRSANRSARTAEQALQEARRPVLVHSRLEDPVQKIAFIDAHWVSVGGGRAVAEQRGDIIYLVMSVRNVGAGIAVLQGWAARPGLVRANEDPAAEGDVHLLTRDLYVPAGDIGIWQGALRDPEHAQHGALREAIEQRGPFSIELHYTDNVGGQRTISRFTIAPSGDEGWMASVGRHFYLDGHSPRDR
ncbi:MAG: hypothetical protein QOG59_2234 [Solirubrobacteraceae bacterium]|nr:hypothetical protein [Solirubrobacteraceae bacterium]